MRRLSILALTCLWLVAAVARGDELQERKSIAREVDTLLEAKDYSRLEAMATEYRQSGARTASGVWKLTLFYVGVSQYLNTRNRSVAYWQAADAAASIWVKQYPTSPTARLAYARMLLNRGWSYRGEGYANQVNPQDWKPLKEYTEQARTYLQAHKALAANDPHWYELMIITAYRLSLAESEFLPIVDEGMSRHPTYYQIYFAALDYLAPKWGGNAAAMEAFARDAHKRTLAIEGNALYARLYWYAAQTQYGDDLFRLSRVDWPLMKKGIDDVLARYPDAWNANHFAKFACLAQDKPKTAELVKRILPTPMYSAWSGYEQANRCVEWSGVFGGKV